MLLADESAAGGHHRQVRPLAALLRDVQGGLRPVQDHVPLPLTLGSRPERQHTRRQGFQGA